MNLALNLCVWLVILAGVTVICLWRAPNIQILSVQSGSMQPLIHKGDAVVVEPVQPSDIRTGDIVSYRSPADARVTVTHRVQSLNAQMGTIVTKGDNAPRADEPFAANEVIGRVGRHVAYAGYGIDLLHSMVGLAIVMYIPAIVAVSLEFRRLAAFYRPTYVLRI